MPPATPCERRGGWPWKVCRFDREGTVANDGTEHLITFLRECLGNRDGGLGNHVDLDLGGVEEPDLEPILYSLLGVTDASELLLGVSCMSTGDLEACRAEWGAPDYHVDLRGGTDSALCWDIWRMSGSTLLRETVAGASLVLAERNPRWVLYTEPDQVSPMIYSSTTRCLVHHVGPATPEPGS